MSVKKLLKRLAYKRDKIKQLEQVLDEMIPTMEKVQMIIDEHGFDFELSGELSNAINISKQARGK